jgi:hypothetical protein
MPQMFSQENCRRAGGYWPAVAFCLIATAVRAGAIANPSAPDPVLAGPPPGPCAAAGPDYVDGVDATGHPVPPANTQTPRVLAGDHALVTVPLHKHRRGEVTVPVDLAALTPPACIPPPHR